MNFKLFIFVLRKFHFCGFCPSTLPAIVNNLNNENATMLLVLINLSKLLEFIANWCTVRVAVVGVKKYWWDLKHNFNKS